MATKALVVGNRRPKRHSKCLKRGHRGHSHRELHTATKNRWDGLRSPTHFTYSEVSGSQS